MSIKGCACGYCASGEAAKGYDLFTSPVVNWEKDVADNPKDIVRIRESVGATRDTVTAELFGCDIVRKQEEPAIRKFESGASRDTDLGKLDFEGFLSPLVLLEFGRYMHLHRIQSDNTLRESDNWQKGIPKTEYMKSLLRHVMDVWLFHREHIGRETMKQALCGVLFNTMGYLHTILIEEDK